MNRLIKMEFGETTPRQLNSKDIIKRLLALAVLSKMDITTETYYFKEKLELLFQYPFVSYPESVLDSTNKEIYDRLMEELGFYERG